MLEVISRADSSAFGNWVLGFGLWDFLVPVRGYAKGGDAENVEFVGIAA
jgi:hypothetical protein